MKSNSGKKYIWLASAGLFALLLVASLGLTPALAQPPSLPHQFYGNVTINGAPAAQGTTVEAYVDGVLNNSTTVDSQGRYGYDPVFTVTGSDGDTVSFKVDGTDASQTATYQSGGFTRLDLHITTTELSVSTSAAASVTSSSATLNGSLNHLGGCTSVDVYFEYGTDTSYGSTTSTQSLTSTGAFSADISGLTASTTYHFRAVASCGGTTVYGLDSTFTTSAPGLSVTTNAATSITATGATLNGTLNDLGTDPSVNVYFQYGTTAAYGSSTIPQSMSAAGPFSASISGLMANTTYHFRAVAQGTTTVYGADMTFTTPTGTLSVTTGSATSISSTSATLNGTLTSLGDATTVHVYFEWGTDTSYGNSTAMQSRSSPGAFSAGITGLSPNTSYHFRAVAVGSTVYGSDATFTTLPANGSTTPPHQFYGTVYVGGAVAGAGVSVDAYVGGSPAASTTTDASGRYGYTSLFLVPGSSGSTVTFYVNGSVVPQTATWSSGGMTRLNLYSAIPSGLTITTTSLPDGTVGVAYSAALQASGGTTPYTWSITSGSLPDGLSLDASSGVISGTPTTAGTSSFTVQVTDSDSPPNTATKPLSITITTGTGENVLDRQVATSSDDCNKYWTGDSWSFGIDRPYFEAGYGRNWAYKLGNGARFTNITIPQGATIATAYLILTCRNETFDNDTVRTKIRGELSLNAATFSTMADFDGRTRTTAEVVWDGIGDWVNGQTYNSPELKSIIQEIVNQSGWTSGNALVIFWDDFDDRSDHIDECARIAHAYDSNPTLAPKLHIEYNSP